MIVWMIFILLSHLQLLSRLLPVLMCLSLPSTDKLIIPVLMCWIFYILVNLFLVLQISFPPVTLVNLGSIVVYRSRLLLLRHLACLN